MKGPFKTAFFCKLLWAAAFFPPAASGEALKAGGKPSSFGPGAAGVAAATEFWFCQTERASGIAVRSLRIHEFKKRCFTLYTAPEGEKILKQSQWPASCQQALKEKKRELLSRFWSCESLPSVSVFYPVLSSPVTN